jgi:hypothetical protein
MMSSVNAMMKIDMNSCLTGLDSRRKRTAPADTDADDVAMGWEDARLAARPTSMSYFYDARSIGKISVFSPQIQKREGNRRNCEKKQAYVLQQKGK